MYAHNHNHTTTHMHTHAPAGGRSPIASTLAYLQAARSGSGDAAWFGLLARRAFDRLLDNAAATAEAACAARHAAGGGADALGAAGVEGGRGAEGEAWGGEERCAACVEGLAVALVEHLGNVGGHEEGAPPQVGVLAEGGGVPACC